MLRRFSGLLLILLLPLLASGQSDHCTGPTYAQLYHDEAGRDVRLTCITTYDSGPDLLLGGMADGDVVLSRLDPEGNAYWRRSFPTGSESTELTLLTGVLVDPEGMLAGVVSYFRDYEQFAMLFRYNPYTDSLLYLRRSPFETDPTGILLDADGHYLVTGGKVNLPAPLFRQSYAQRFRRSDGLPFDGGHLMDLRGEETIFDIIPLPGGGYLSAGQASVYRGAGGVRASLLWHDETGRPGKFLVGTLPPDGNGRLFGFDVELVDGKIFLLQWGDIDKITGAVGTKPQLSVFDLQGQLLWHREYDVQRTNGEVAMEMVRHDDGVLVYGYTLVGFRQIFLMHIDLTGTVSWCNRYEFPGEVQVFQRANRQLLSLGDRILLTATYSFSGERPHEGLLLQLDRTGHPLADCIPVIPLEVMVSSPPATWYPETLTDLPSAEEWTMVRPTGTPPPELAAYDDCDMPCERCETRSFQTVYLCPGDSVLVSRAWQREAGLITDTLARTEGCDSLATTEIVVSAPLQATARELPGCGTSLHVLEITAEGGLPPYTYEWSDSSSSGPRAYLEAGSYTVTVSSAAGCAPLVLPITVEGQTDTRLQLRTTPPSCPAVDDGTIVLLPAGTGGLKLLTDTLFRQDSLTGLSPGTYSFIVQLEGGCEVYREATVGEPPPFGVELSGPLLARLGDPVTFTARTDQPAGGISFSWSADTMTACTGCPDFTLQAVESTTVRVTITHPRGCTATDSLFLAVERGEPRVYVPNVFSPNDDGTNDRWVPGFGPDVARILAWRVYDRWGHLAWAFDPEEGERWDGGDAGAGVYLYTLSVALLDGSTASSSGEVTVVR